MGFFSNQLSNIVEWEQFRDDMIFWKWDNKEIKKGSKLIIRPGQDAIFMFNGKIEGIFKDEGSFDIESQIIPFLSTLKGFKFGFNSGMRAEVLFVNTKELTVKWGTKNAINIPAPNLPGGMPIKSFGTFCCKVDDYNILIDKIAGVKKQFRFSHRSWRRAFSGASPSFFQSIFSAAGCSFLPVLPTISSREYGDGFSHSYHDTYTLPESDLTAPENQ